MTIDLMKNIAFPLVLGRQGEGGVTNIVFDFSGLRQAYGDGSLYLVLKRQGEIFPVALDVSGDLATWTVSNVETDVPGKGEAQLSYMVAGKIKKTIIYKTIVLPSLMASGPAPDPYNNWLDTLGAMGGQIAADKASAQEAIAADKTEALSAIETNKMDALGDIAGAKGGALEDITASQVNAVQAVTDAKDTAIGRIREEASVARQYAEAAEASAGNASQSAQDAEEYARQAQSYAENLHFTESNTGDVVISIGE